MVGVAQLTTPMWLNTTNTIPGITAAASLANVGSGWWLSDALLAGGGVCGLAFVLMRVPFRKRWRKRRRKRTLKRNPPTVREQAAPAAREPADPNDLDAVVEQMLEQGRYALLLRPQIIHNLSEDHFSRALEMLQDATALVPDGEVVLGEIDEALEDGKLDEEEIRSYQGRVVQVDRFFLDRYPVTNEEFYEFVAAGGYQQSAMWDPAILPAVLDFVDQTGRPGPRFWTDGRYDSAKADHPVVGVSWYEAQAYARWVGKRLATDAEWVKAGSWPVKVAANTRLQRRYPWGDAMDRSKANLWSSQRRGTASVEEYSDGVSVGGVYQLIGNVWEWTRGNFVPRDLDGERLLLEASMKSIRGGAFDTYFENQATCQFQSGEFAITRKLNLGFRCAVGVCDLVLARSAGESLGEVNPGTSPLEEAEA